MCRSSQASFVALHALALIMTSRGVSAAPQLNSSLVVGIAGQGQRPGWERTAFALGGRGDIMFGRTRDADGAIGPYVEVGSADSFRNAYVGGGVTALAPVHPYLPLVLSLGGQGLSGAGGQLSPALAASIFWGSRGYNFDSKYGLAAGLFVEGSYGLGGEHATTCVAGAQIDTMLLALPVILLIEALRGR